MLAPEEAVDQTVAKAPPSSAVGGLLESLADWFGPEGLRRIAERGGASLRDVVDRDIALIDTLIAEQVDAILHHPQFQRLEAAWRGLEYLTSQAANTDGVVIRVLQASWAEVCRDQERAVEFDQSAMFEKVYEDEFGTAGGRPYGLLIGVYDVQHRRTPGHNTDDVSALRGLAVIAAAAFAPLVVGSTPVLLGLDSWSDLGQPIDLASPFRHPDYARWHQLQAMEEARFLGVVLPRVLMRTPYGDELQRALGFRYREEVLDHEDHLWGSGVFAFASVVIRAFGDYRWFADIRGLHSDGTGGGLVSDLPARRFDAEGSGNPGQSSAEVMLTETQDRVLSELGFIALNPCRFRSDLVFYSNQSIQRARLYEKADANASAKLSTMLQYMLCVSRFAHHLKVMVRDAVGSMITPEEIEDRLHKWLMGFSLGNEAASMEMKARYPLREASVQVKETPGKPGVYQCLIQLRPHFQLDLVESAFSLTTELVVPQST